MSSTKRVLALALLAGPVVLACQPPTTSPPPPAIAPPPPTTSPPAVTTPWPADSGFVAFGDFGGGSAQYPVAAEMGNWAATHRVDALVTTGDNVYGDATHDEGDPALFDDYLDAPYAGLRPPRPLWVTLGNHDVADGHGAEQLRYLGLPDLPYAKELPGVQLLFVDANDPEGVQATWLDARLSEPGPRLRVVVFHQPAYSCARHGSTAAVLENWVPIFERHHVALVLAGHDHYYERFVSEAGVTYVVTGGGGRGLYARNQPCVWDGMARAWAVRHHFAAVEVSDNHLRLTAVAPDGTVIDQTVISR